MQYVKDIYYHYNSCKESLDIMITDFNDKDFSIASVSVKEYPNYKEELPSIYEKMLELAKDIAYDLGYQLL